MARMRTIKLLSRGKNVVRMARLKISRPERILALFLVLLFFIANCEGRRAFRNVFTNHTVFVNPKYTNVNLTIEQNPSRFTMFVDLKVLLETCYSTITLNMITMSGKTYPNFIHRTVDMCEFMLKPSSDPMMNMVHDELSKSGEWLPQCPIKQGLYIVRNFTLNSERFPTYTPEMKYNVTIQYLFAPDKRKPNELVEMVKIYVLGKMDSTSDVKRRRLALGRPTKKPGKH